ncbi:hypothetical protein DL240_17830 [Lujinxingia litoralis]|uniref:Uncharacterized protein n=1 Tax=Lujinxingia litoralis TaxID=2211119 RepID=A0A328C364_9DELT|nr:hypothetical protein DL240_17830 [Lujinxingia litoralis]
MFEVDRRCGYAARQTHSPANPLAIAQRGSGIPGRRAQPTGPHRRGVAFECARHPTQEITQGIPLPGRPAKKRHGPGEVHRLAKPDAYPGGIVHAELLGELRGSAPAPEHTSLLTSKLLPGAGKLGEIRPGSQSPNQRRMAFGKPTGDHGQRAAVVDAVDVSQRVRGLPQRALRRHPTAVPDHLGKRGGVAGPGRAPQCRGSAIHGVDQIGHLAHIKPLRPPHLRGQRSPQRLAQDLLRRLQFGTKRGDQRSVAGLKTVQTPAHQPRDSRWRDRRSGGVAGRLTGQGTHLLVVTQPHYQADQRWREPQRIGQYGSEGLGQRVVSKRREKRRVDPNPGPLFVEQSKHRTSLLLQGLGDSPPFKSRHQALHTSGLLLSPQALFSERTDQRGKVPFEHLHSHAPDPALGYLQICARRLDHRTLFHTCSSRPRQAPGGAQRSHFDPRGLSPAS